MSGGSTWATHSTHLCGEDVRVRATPGGGTKTRCKVVEDPQRKPSLTLLDPADVPALMGRKPACRALSRALFPLLGADRK